MKKKNKTPTLHTYRTDEGLTMAVMVVKVGERTSFDGVLCARVAFQLNFVRTEKWFMSGVGVVWKLDAPRWLY